MIPPPTITTSAALRMGLASGEGGARQKRHAGLRSLHATRSNRTRTASV
jgi:hypothetical protein